MRNSELCWLGRGEEALRDKKDEQPERQEENQAVGITEAKRRGTLLVQGGRKGSLVGATVSNALERSIKLWIESELLGGAPGWLSVLDTHTTVTTTDLYLVFLAQEVFPY